jgi:hypothetical protein
MAIKQLKLTREQIKEFVGDDLSKIRVIEKLISTAIVVDETTEGMRQTLWNDGRMEIYPIDPASSTGGTVEFPTPFHVDTETPNITSDGDFTISAISQTGFTWTSTVDTSHMWRAIGRWKS